MTWEVGTDPPVVGQAIGATRGACARQWSRDCIVSDVMAPDPGVPRQSTFEYGGLLSTRDLSEGM